MKVFDKVVISQFVLAAAIVVIVNLLVGISPGWLSWGLSLPAWVIVAITTLARVKDITATSKRWMVRRGALTLAGAGATALIAAPLLGYSNAFPMWYSVITWWGIAGILITSPQQPPWWKYINGDWKLKKGQQI